MIFYAVDVFSGIGMKHVVMEIMEGKMFSRAEENQVTNVTSTYSSGYLNFLNITSHENCALNVQ